MQNQITTNSMELGMSLDRDPKSQELSYPQRPDTMEHQNEEQKIASLNMKLAVLLNKEQHAVSSLSAAQCYTIINTVKRVQRARDTEIIQMLKPFTDSLDELIPRLKEWRRLFHGSGLHQPHAELMFKLEELVKTELGMKPGFFVLEGDVLLAIEASNKILRALAVEKKYVGLSKPMSLLKRNVKQTMIDIQGLLNLIINAHEPVPGARFRPSNALDATKGQVILLKGRPFYVDPKNEDLVVCGPKHPLIKAPGSEWNKWIKLPLDLKHRVQLKIKIPDGAFRDFREQLISARQIELDNIATRDWAFEGTFYNAREEAKFLEYVDRKIKQKSTNRENEGEIDFEHVEHLDWDMPTYLKMLDHKEVDYKLAPPEESWHERPLWYYITQGAEWINFLHPGYCYPVSALNERIDHPCEFSLFEELEVDFSKLRMAPEEANGALTPYLYEDAAMGDASEVCPEEVGAIGSGQFSKEGLYLDTRKDKMWVKVLSFYAPRFRPKL